MLNSHYTEALMVFKDAIITKIERRPLFLDIWLEMNEIYMNAHAAEI